MISMLSPWVGSGLIIFHGLSYTLQQTILLLVKYRGRKHTTFGNRFNSQTQCIICVTVRRRKARPAPAYQEKSESLVCEAFRLLLVGNWLSHTSSSMIVLGKQVGEVWKIPRIPPRASPSEEYSEFPDFSSLFTQDYIKPGSTNNWPRLLSGTAHFIQFVCGGNFVDKAMIIKYGQANQINK